MISSLRSALALPSYQDEADKARVTAFLRATLLITAVAIPVEQLVFVPSDPIGRRLAVAGTWLAIVLGVFVLLRQRRVRAASTMLLAMVWLWITAQNTTAGGVAAPSFAAFVLLVFTAGVLLGGPGALAIGSLSIATQVLFAVAQVNGLLPALSVENTTLRHLASNVTVLFLAAPVVWLALTSLQDTLRRTQDSEKRLADILEFLPDATFVIDASGRVKAWNAAMEGLTGVAAGEILGKGDYEYALPFYGTRRPILIDLALRPREEIERSYAGLRRDGDAIFGEAYVSALRGGGVYLMATAARLHAADGSVFGAVECIRDVTDLKHVQEELEKARETAESANRAKSAFLAMVSHEIRTPMNAILGLSNLLLDGELPAQQRDFARTIRSSGDGLLSTLNDILDFSKIEAGRLDLESRPFAVRECVESALDLFTHRCRSKGIELRPVIDPRVPDAIVGDSARLRQVLANLVGNAVKFTEAGEVTVSVSARQVEGAPPGADAEPTDPDATLPWCELQFAVRDTGIGIPEARKSRLFQAFSQVDSSTARRYGGTGLGLVISKRLVELMGGEIWVESEEGHGSTFAFFIRAMASAEPVSVSPTGGESIPQVGHRHPLSILLAEDNATNRTVALATLERLGYHAAVAVNGVEVLDALRGKPYDAVLMDIHMPEKDGPTATREIRRTFAADRQPWIVALSADATAEGRRACLDAGMNDYLCKPFQVQDLIAALSRVPRKGTPVTSAQSAERGPSDDLAQPVDEGAVLDRSAVDRVRDLLGSQADTAFPHVLQEFLDGSARLLVEAQQAFDASDPEGLRRAAHTLKSSSATFGAALLCGVARELETLARQGTVDGAGALLARARDEYARARAALERTLSGR